MREVSGGRAFLWEGTYAGDLRYMVVHVKRRFSRLGAEVWWYVLWYNLCVF